MLECNIQFYVLLIVKLNYKLYKHPFKTMDPTEDDVKEYIQQLTEQEKVILNIAKLHLGSSFDMFKSIGFIQWFKDKMKRVA
jgi:hypothetical protein